MADWEEEFDSEVEEDEEDEEDEQEQEEGEATRREPIYNVDGMHEKLEDFGWTTEAGWEETQMITSTTETRVANVDDDLARELAFYNQALAATQEAIGRFERAGVPWLRPVDYYAEMVKTDDHMAKVKEQLMFEQKQIELAEERRKQREQKQYGKQVQAERVKQKAQDKKRQIDSISKLRKQREKSGFSGELDVDAEIDNIAKGRSPQRQQFHDRNQPHKKGGEPINKKRQMKNSKYGFGGSKRAQKQNDAYSAADMDGYKGSSKGGFGNKGGKGGGKGGPHKAKGGVKKATAAKQRPGKGRRQAMKGKGGGKR